MRLDSSKLKLENTGMSGEKIKITKLSVEVPGNWEMIRLGIKPISEFL